jgi:lipoyl(octanoyl) transferase
MKIINKKNSQIDFLVSKRLVAYDNAINFMENRVNNIAKGIENEAIWFLEHPSIYTTGRSFVTKTDNIDSIPIYNTGRGGKVTWHGPGQRIIYFMINIKKRNNNIRTFVFDLESYIINCLKELDIKAYKKKDLIGIWTKDTNGNDAKIASLGLRVSKGVIYHGLSININCNLSFFSKIDPCGIKDSYVTSIFAIKKNNIKRKFDKILENNIFNIFN